MVDKDAFLVMKFLQKTNKSYQIKQIFTKNQIKQIFIDSSYPRKRYLDEEVEKDALTEKIVHTWLIETTNGQESEITDLFSIIHLPKDKEEFKFCQLFYLSGCGHKVDTLAILAIQNAIKLGYTHIEATDLMDQFQVLTNDQFGFR